MSIEALNLALNAKTGNAAKKAVLLGLANHASADGSHCFPSVRRLAVYSELSESAVRTKLSELRSEGLIRVVKRASQHRPTEYAIDLRKLETMRDPDLQELEAWKTPPISGDAQTSRSKHPDLQQVASRPPAAGPEPSVNRHLTVRGSQPKIGAFADDL